MLRPYPYRTTLFQPWVIGEGIVKSVELKNGRFLAKFQNGEQTTQKPCADFFMMMQDKGAAVEELEGYIKLCKMMEPFHPWDEIERIASTFQKQAA